MLLSTHLRPQRRTSQISVEAIATTYCSLAMSCRNEQFPSPFQSDSDDYRTRQTYALGTSFLKALRHQGLPGFDFASSPSCSPSGVSHCTVVTPADTASDRLPIFRMNAILRQLSVPPSKLLAITHTCTQRLRCRSVL